MPVEAGRLIFGAEVMRGCTGGRLSMVCSSVSFALAAPTQDTTPSTPSLQEQSSLFLGCAVIDFVCGYVHERTIPAGVISVVGGLFGAAFYLLVLKWLVEHDNDPTDPSRRQVPCLSP